jgi:hypothetical protein
MFNGDNDFVGCGAAPGPGLFEVLKIQLSSQLQKEQWRTLAGLFPTEDLPRARRESFRSGRDLLDWMEDSQAISLSNVTQLKQWLRMPEIGASNLVAMVEKYECERDSTIARYAL